MLKKKILIVDDEPEIARMLFIRLTAQGYEAEIAGDGEEALKKAFTFGPDLILLDIMMPKIDGLQVCRNLKHNVTTASIPILIISVKIDSSSKGWAHVSGADDYIEKPFEAEVLLSKIKKLLHEDKTI